MNHEPSITTVLQAARDLQSEAGHEGAVSFFASRRHAPMASIGERNAYYTLEDATICTALADVGELAFSELDQDERRKIARRLQAGETVHVFVDAGAAVVAVYVGELRIWRWSEEGEEQHVATVH